MGQNLSQPPVGVCVFEGLLTAALVDSLSSELESRDSAAAAARLCTEPPDPAVLESNSKTSLESESTGNWKKKGFS